MTKRVIGRDHNNVTVLTSVENPGHDYLVQFDHPNTDPRDVRVHFQQGAVREHGVNGITSEALLDILIDRTVVLNNAFPCSENEVAISGLRAAKEAFESRTRDRLARNVEGKNEL